MPPNDEPEDAEFFRVYGPWQPLSPAELKALMRGFPHPWWLVGGHAIEAFTGVRRSHEDIDLSFFAGDLNDLRRQLEGRYHLWSNHGGTVRVLDDNHPEPLHPLAQVWIREHAGAPWVLDAVPSPESDGLWQSKRDEQHIADLEAVTWVNSDGIRYQNPEITLLFKAARPRPKDEVDLTNTWPLLGREQQGWLLEAIQRLYPGHAWLTRLAHA